VAAVEAALGERGEPSEAARRAAADARLSSTSWDRTWNEMDALVRDAAARRHPIARKTTVA